MRYFSFDELLDEIQDLIGGYLQVSRILFGPQAHQALMPEAKLVGLATVAVPRGEVVDLPIAWRLRKCYDYVFTGRWDWMGGIYHLQDFYLELMGFADMMQRAADHDLAPKEPKLLHQLITATLGRWKIDDPECDFADALTLSEASILTGMTEQSVRNAASRGEIGLELCPSNELVVGESGLRREQYLVGTNAFEWVQSRQGYLRRPPGVPAFYDSIDEIDPRKFMRLADLGALLHTRCEECGVDAKRFEQRVGRPLEDYSDHTRLTYFQLQEWLSIAKLTGLNPMWLVARLFKTADVALTLDHVFQFQTMAVLERQAARRKEEMLIVPVAADGSWFSPDLKRRNGYLIGRKGVDERYVADYFEALDELNKMDPPYWRRPSATTGKMGSVKGVSWREVSKRALFKVHTNDKKKGTSDAAN